MKYLMLVLALVTSYAQGTDWEPFNPLVYSTPVVDTPRTSLSQHEYERRNKKIETAQRMRTLMKYDLRDTFGGLYVEHEPEFKIVFLFTQNAEKNLARYAEDQETAFMLHGSPEARFFISEDKEFIALTSPRSIYDMINMQNYAGYTLAQKGIRFDSEIDVKNSEIIFYVEDVEKAKKHLGEPIKIHTYIKVKHSIYEN